METYYWMEVRNMTMKIATGEKMMLISFVTLQDV